MVKVLRRLVSRRGIFVLGYVVWLQLVEEARNIRKRRGLREARWFYFALVKYMKGLFNVLEGRFNIDNVEMYEKLRTIVLWGIQKNWGGLEDYGDLILGALALVTGYGIVTLDKDFVVFGKEFGVKVKYIEQERLQNVIAKVL